MKSNSRQSKRGTNQQVGECSVSPDHALLNHWKQIRNVPVLDDGGFDESNDMVDYDIEFRANEAHGAESY